MKDVLGSESNGIMWPNVDSIAVRGTQSDDEDEDEEVMDELETPQNLRLLRIGMSLNSKKLYTINPM